MTNKLQNKQKFSFKNIFGDRDFIKTFLKSFLPAAFQAILSVVIIYVDNFSISTLIKDHETATIAKEALGLANPVIDFLVLITCGWIGGMGVVLSQYFGNQDANSIRKTVAFRIWSSVVILIPFILIISLIPGKLIVITSDTEVNGMSYNFARIYLFYSGFTFIPFAITTALSFSLQETKRAGISFLSSFAGVITNIILDPLVIVFVNDINQVIMLVALSTGIARIVQIIFILIYIWVKKDNYLWFFKSWVISWRNMFYILKHSITVFYNESLFAIANLLLAICMLRFNPNIHDATTNLVLMVQFVTMVWPGTSAATAVLIGSELGKNNVEKAKENTKNLISWGVLIGTLLGIIMFVLACFVNNILSPAATEEMILLSRNMEWVVSPLIVCQGIFAITYNAIKVGGSRLIVFIDGGISILWLLFVLPITFTNTAANWDPLWFLFLIESSWVLKLIISFVLLKFTNWTKVLTDKKID